MLDLNKGGVEVNTDGYLDAVREPLELIYILNKFLVSIVGMTLAKSELHSEELRSRKLCMFFYLVHLSTGKVFDLLIILVAQ